MPENIYKHEFGHQNPENNKNEALELGDILGDMQKVADERIFDIENAIDDSSESEKSEIEQSVQISGFTNADDEIISMMQSGNEKGDQNERAEEILQENAEENANLMINMIAMNIWGAEVVDEYPEKLLIIRSALSTWKSNDDLSGLRLFKSKFNDPKITEKEKAAMITRLQSSGLTDDEVNKLINFIIFSKESIDYVDNVRQAEKTKAAAEQGLIQKYYEGTENIDPKNKEALLAQLDANFRMMAKENKALAEVLERQQRESVILQIIEQKIALREATENPPQTKEEIATVLKTTNTSEKFNSFPAPVQAKIEDIVREGGATVITTMMQRNMLPSDNGYEAEVSGARVELNVADGNLYIVGEHAYDVMNRGQYKIDPPSPAGFDQTFLRMIVDQNEVASMAEPALHEVLLGIAEEFGDDARNNTLMQEDDANRFHNFIQLMLGEDNIEASEEISRLQKLGIIDSSESGGVDHQRLSRIRRAIVEYIPTATDNIRIHQLGMDYQHFQTLADLWNHTGNDTILPSVDSLQKLTERLPADAIERSRVLQEYCEENGYIVG